MKRRKELDVTESGSGIVGSEPDVPWPKKRMTETPTSSSSATVDNGAASTTVCAPRRFGFGFRPSFTSSKSTTAQLSVSLSSNASSEANNQSEDAHGMNTGPETLSSETPESANANTKEAMEDTRANGRLTYRERSLPRPSVRKSGTSVGTSAAPQSTGRMTLKHGVTNGASSVLRRASVATSSSSRQAEQLAVAPTPLARRASARVVSVPTEAPTVGESLKVTGKENSNPLEQSGIEVVLASRFTPELMEELEAAFQLKVRGKKFDVKGRTEQLQSHNRQMKGVIRTVCDTILAAQAEWGAYAKEAQTEKASQEARFRRMQTLMAEKDMLVCRASEEKSGLRREIDVMEKRNRELSEQSKHLLEQLQHDARVRTELESTNQRLLSQLQQAQKQNDELSLELRSHKATMSDRVQLYEETKREMEQMYKRHNEEEEKSKRAEAERWQSRITEAREELAAANQEKETLRQRSNTIEDDLRKERGRCSLLEREKFAMEAQVNALESRLASSSAEVTEVKTKLKEKESDLSRLVDQMAEIQKLAVVSSSKIDDEKKDLTDKIELLQVALRESERSDAINVAALRELRVQFDALQEAKTAWSQREMMLQEQLKACEQQLQDITRESSVELGKRQMMETHLKELRAEQISLNAQLEATKWDMKQTKAMLEDEKRAWQTQMAALEERNRLEKAELAKRIEILQEEKVSAETEVQMLRASAADVRGEDLEELCQVKRELEVLRLRLKEVSNYGSQSIAEKDALIEELQEKVRQGDKLRRVMHNTIQELRGNVRVFARTRPFLPSDGCKDPEAIVPVVSCEYDGQTMKLRRQAKGSTGSDQDTYTFAFDKVFPPSAGQDSVFEEISEFVQSAIDGYHVCLFSYGQTGSGKTHTMQGSGNGQMRGIIPRAIEKVLSDCEYLKTQGWNYTMQVSFLEIYNETLKDLLAGRDDANKVLNIKKDTKGGVHVPELTLVDVREMAQVEKLMERASRARSVASTDMNAQSSRSHSVFTLHLQGMNESEGIQLDGQLNLVDLAGSERASRSNVSGDRLKETQAINKSLSCLADVFTAIGNKSAHIPFRNSKLTYLLQSSLSGDGKTLMMVNVSPTQESASETLCSLRFAQQVNKCELGKPKRQIKSSKDV